MHRISGLLCARFTVIARPKLPKKKKSRSPQPMLYGERLILKQNPREIVSLFNALPAQDQSLR